MNIDWLNELSHEFSGFGCSPTPMELLALTNSVRLLCERSNHDDAYFWGKIRGSERNYLIVICYTGSLLGKQTAYASLDAVSWFGLPAVTQKLLWNASNVHTRIKGNPLTKTIVRHPRKKTPFDEIQPLVPKKPKNLEEEEEEEEKKEEHEEDEEEEKDEEEEVSDYFEYTIEEVDRIAAIVHLISKDGLIFPQKSLIWKSSQYVTRNPVFTGVPDVVRLDDFCRLKSKIRGENARVDGLVDAMPLLSEDHPANAWVISRQKYSDTVKICNRLWTGLVFISKGDKWGQVYLGSGDYNFDFLFSDA